MEIKLNENDERLLELCEPKSRSVNELAKILNISPASISVRIKKLKECGLIQIEDKGKGRRKLIRSKKGNKEKKYMAEVLKKVKASGGEMWLDDYMKIYPLSETLEDKEGYDKHRSVNQVLFSTPNLIRQKVVLTDKGKEFLKENK